MRSEARRVLGPEHFGRHHAELAIQILDHARAHGRVTTRDMVRSVGASSNTLKATFATLVDKQLLTRHGGGRSIRYGLS